MAVEKKRREQASAGVFEHAWNLPVEWPEIDARQYFLFRLKHEQTHASCACALGLAMARAPARLLLGRCNLISGHGDGQEALRPASSGGHS